MPTLSKRLETIASLVPFGARVCDIGCDHGYLSIDLTKSGKSPFVIAADVREKPLNKAKINAKKLNANNIDFRLSNGFSTINFDEFDVAVIAGMGAEVIVGILKNAEELIKQKAPTLIFQPTTSPEILREYLYTNGFSIEKEIPVFENEKLYSIMRAKFCGKEQNLPYYRYFIGELNCKTEIGKRYIEKQYNRCFKCAESIKDTPQTEKYRYFKELSDDLQNFLSQNEEL